MGHTVTEKNTLRFYGLPTIMFILGAAFYLYEFSLQVAPGAMTQELMASLKIHAGALGTISGMFYLGYMPMQIPAGIFYDRFGPRKTLTVAILMCAAGAMVFAHAHTVFTAGLGRFFIGFGSAFSFVGALVIISRWYKPKYFAVMAGVAQFLSSVGAIIGGAPMAACVQHFGWRQTMWVLALVGIGLAAVIALFLQNAPKGRRVKHETHQPLKELKDVLSNKQTWYVALYGFGIWGPVVAFAALWGIPYLMHVYHIDAVHSATFIAAMWLGIGIGSPAIGWMGDYYKLRKFPLVQVSVMGLLLSLALILFPAMPKFLMYIVLFLMGFAAGGQSASFGFVNDNNQEKNIGTACGFNNMAVVLGGLVFQPLIGFLLHYFWLGEIKNGVHIYHLLAYQKAFIVLPFSFLLAVIAIQFLIKETHATSTVRGH